MKTHSIAAMALVAAAVVNAAPMDRVKQSLGIQEYQECSPAQFQNKRKGTIEDGEPVQQPTTGFTAGPGTQLSCLQFDFEGEPMTLTLLKDGSPVKATEEESNKIGYNGQRGDYQYEITGTGDYELFYNFPPSDSCAGRCDGSADSGCFCDVLSQVIGDSCFDYANECGVVAPRNMPDTFGATTREEYNAALTSRRAAREPCKQNQYQSKRLNRGCEEGDECLEPFNTDIKAGLGNHRVCIDYDFENTDLKVSLLYQGQVVKTTDDVEGENSFQYGGERGDYKYLIEGTGDYDFFYTAPPFDSCEGNCGNEAPAGCFCDEIALVGGDGCFDIMEQCYALVAPENPSNAQTRDEYLAWAAEQESSKSGMSAGVVAAVSAGAVAVAAVGAGLLVRHRRNKAAFAEAQARVEENQA